MYAFRHSLITTRSALHASDCPVVKTRSPSRVLELVTNGDLPARLEELKEQGREIIECNCLHPK